ncbi:GNAT family N-acetyltransferase [Zhenhengia yiwuensis]|uniref:GNAT family N-acetyltransferase n=1 Tax=Zhenhengia yiwuensis TaxID=2763666 RepID=A0A926IFU7_9FIRM|nr:GNAT family N-acetyltransferase [Zhenhengia yiwuensis]MBC8581409.1 GNAT family N-acetyltransferase [Zhenhengia yiwuensis]
MNQSIQAKRKDGELVKLTLKRLTFEDIDQIMALQDEIVEGLEDKQLYVPSGREEIQSHFSTEGVLLGYVTEENELAALAIYLKRGYSPSNYGYDVGLEGEELLKVGQVDTVLVKADYRGNNLQYRMCSLLEEIAKEKQTPILCATASPYNTFSVNNFLKLGYEVKKDKLKYGGLRRYILMKSLY